MKAKDIIIATFLYILFIVAGIFYFCGTVLCKFAGMILNRDMSDFPGLFDFKKSNERGE